MQSLVTLLDESPVISAVKDTQTAHIASCSAIAAAFVLRGDIESVPEIIRILRQAGKGVYIHLDLISGLAGDTAAVKYVAKQWRPDGIISTHTNVLKAAADLNMTGIQRLFVLDSASLERGIESVRRMEAEYIELMPGIATKAIRYFKEKTKLHIIAGGLITQRSEIYEALNAGAVGVSCSDPEIWNM